VLSFINTDSSIEEKLRL